MHSIIVCNRAQFACYTAADCMMHPAANYVYLPINPSLDFVNLQVTQYLRNQTHVSLNLTDLRTLQSWILHREMALQIAAIGH